MKQEEFDSIEVGSQLQWGKKENQIYLVKNKITINKRRIKVDLLLLSTNYLFTHYIMDTDDSDVELLKKDIAKVCKCPEDHQHNDRGCITGMCSCRVELEAKIILVDKKSHNFDKYCRRPLRNDNGQITGYLSLCIDCGTGINAPNQVCTPDPDWRVLQEKQFTFYMEEANKVKKMNSGSI